MKHYSESALEWLSDQQVPNSTEPEPHRTRKHLPIGYEIPRRDAAFAHLGRRAYTYDAAVAAIAFSAAGEFSRAEDILIALRRLSDEDGRLWFAYNTNNAWPNDEDSEGAIVRTGTVAWAGYAATFYLRMTEDEPVRAGDRRTRRRIRELAERAAGYVTARQVDSRQDPRYGLATGGFGSTAIDVADSGEIEERHDPVRIEWASAEHNIDAYFLLRDLHRLSGNEAFSASAKAVAQGLESLWDDDARQLIRGVAADGTRDEVLPLDTGSWGSMFFLARGERERAELMLEAVDTRFAVERSHGTGYIPYEEGTLYTQGAIDDAYVSSGSNARPEDDPVWIEGTLGVAVARAKAGDRAAAADIISSMHAYRHDNGGFQYAEHEVPHQFMHYRSVAATAWYVIAVRVVEDDEVRRTFWGK
ncbi:MAG: hypothetical protein ACQETQ_13395 [Spirochaetota bacterium]